MKYCLHQGVEARDSLFTFVNKLQLLGLIPDCPENHHNVQLILDQLGLTGVEFCTTADLKLGNTTYIEIKHHQKYFLNHLHSQYSGWQSTREPQVWLSLLLSLLPIQRTRRPTLSHINLLRMVTINHR